MDSIAEMKVRAFDMIRSWETKTAEARAIHQEILELSARIAEAEKQTVSAESREE